MKKNGFIIAAAIASTLVAGVAISAANQDQNSSGYAAKLMADNGTNSAPDTTNP